MDASARSTALRNVRRRSDRALDCCLHLQPAAWTAIKKILHRFASSDTRMWMLLAVQKQNSRHGVDILDRDQSPRQWRPLHDLALAEHRAAVETEIFANASTFSVRAA
jgi:hypothetical protein